MRYRYLLTATLLALLAVTSRLAFADDRPQEVKERQLDAPNGLKVKVRMQGPYDMDTPLQVVCYFKHNTTGDTTLGAAVELDKRLHGVIASLRNRQEFTGTEFETILIAPPKGTIQPKMLLLIGLGDEASLSLDRMEQIGSIAMREATRLGVNRVAFAPLIRDQGNSKFAAGDVAHAVLRGAILAYDTERRLQVQGLAKNNVINEWVQEAGPDYFDETVAGTQRAINEAGEMIGARPSDAYASNRD